MKRFVLAMNDIGQQQPIRFSMSASYAQVTSTGCIDATCRLFVVVQSLILNRQVESGTVPALDSLQPESLAKKLIPQLSAIVKLRDPGLDPEEQQTSLAAFQEVHAGQPTDLVRDAGALAKVQILTEMERCRSGIRNIYGSAPSAVQGIAEMIRLGLDQVRLPDPNWKPLTRWMELKRISDKLRQRRGVLPSDTLKAVQEAVASEGRSLYQQTLGVVAVEKIAQAWQPAKAEQIAFLRDVKKFGTEVVAALGAVKKCLEAHRTAVAADQQVSRASVVRPLPGPTEVQVIAGMLTQTRAADESDLARIVLGLWEARLRQICRQVCAWIDSTSPLPDLLRGIPPEKQAEEFEAVIEGSQGPGQSLYEIIERDGITDCAEFLFHRSEPTVHLAGRHMAQLGLGPQHFCIVTLPKTNGPNDATIRERLISAFEKLDPLHATFVEAAATDRTVTVIRILDGFVIGIEEQNANLLNHYVYAAEQGHRPHLYGLMPDSPDGKALGSYVDLQQMSATNVPAQRAVSHPSSPSRKEQLNGSAHK